MAWRNFRPEYLRRPDSPWLRQVQRSLPGGVEVNKVPDMLWHREAFDVAARLDFGSDIF